MANARLRIVGSSGPAAGLAGTTMVPVANSRSLRRNAAARLAWTQHARCFARHLRRQSPQWRVSVPARSNGIILTLGSLR